MKAPADGYVATLGEYRKAMRAKRAGTRSIAEERQELEVREAELAVATSAHLYHAHLMRLLRQRRGAA